MPTPGLPSPAGLLVAALTGRMVEFSLLLEGLQTTREVNGYQPRGVRLLTLECMVTGPVQLRYGGLITTMYALYIERKECLHNGGQSLMYVQLHVL